MKAYRCFDSKLSLEFLVLGLEMNTELELSLDEFGQIESNSKDKSIIRLNNSSLSLTSLVMCWTRNEYNRCLSCSSSGKTFHSELSQTDSGLSVICCMHSTIECWTQISNCLIPSMKCSLRSHWTAQPNSNSNRTRISSQLEDSSLGFDAIFITSGSLKTNVWPKMFS